MRINFQLQNLFSISLLLVALNLAAQQNDQLEVVGDARINGALKINNPSTTGYQLPISDGSPRQVLTTNGSGDVEWSSLANTIQQSSTANFVHNGMPRDPRRFFIRIPEAPAAHNISLPELDNTEIQFYGYEFIQFPGGPSSCDNISFSLTKPFDRTSPILKRLNFEVGSLTDMEMYVYKQGSNNVFFLETSMVIQEATIKSIRLQTLTDSDFQSQLCEVVELNINGFIESAFISRDAQGNVTNVFEESFDCLNGQ